MWILRATVDEEPVVFRLPPGAARTLGRGTNADFIVGDALMSRVHCRLTASERQLVIEDLQSTNGTYVNDVRLKLSTLDDGDRVRLGQVEFSVSHRG
jgi:pSer/pThr/pTyr-binding forkhead associated (FHA) protein